MQDGIYGSHDEIEPRRMPKQASKFDTRPVPVVPEVSLILDKPRQIKKMDHSVSDTIPELRSYRVSDTNTRGTESYAAWKEKQFPLQSIKSSRQPVKSYSSLDCNDFKFKNQIFNNDSPSKYRDARESAESSNKYTLTHSKSCSEIDHINNSSDYKLRSHNKDEGKEDKRDKIYERDERDERRYERDVIDERRFERDEIDERNERKYERDKRKDKRKFAINEGKYERNEKKDWRNERRYQMKDYDDGSNFDYSYFKDVSVNRCRPAAHRSSSLSNTNSYIHRSMSGECDSKHSKSMQTMNCSQECFHNCSGCCNLNRSKCNRDTETIKNLLQIVTSQNDQIKALQRQVERLLKLHEQNLKDRSQCTCQSNGIVYKNSQLYDQSQNANLPVSHSNLNKGKEKCFSDVKLQDEKIKQTILEQKVSIGVMTSFELKVQNNPSLRSENDTNKKNNQEKIVSSLETSNMIKNLVNDTGEMIRKKPNFFTPTPLENISEGSESHISSLRQSHLCADSLRPSFTQDSIEVTNANFRMQNSPETDSLERNGEPKRFVTACNNTNIEDMCNLDYKDDKQAYQERRDNIKDRIDQYNLQYRDLCTSPQENIKQKGRISDDYNEEPILNDITKTKNIKLHNIADDCLSLSSSELDLDEPSPPSPEPSIHVDLQEYSSENGSLPPQQPAKVGWTLYNNVVDQVNQILQNSPLNDNSEKETSNVKRKNERKEFDNNVIMDTVKAATLEQLTKLGISFSDNVDQRELHSNKKVAFDASSYSRKVPDTHLIATSTSIETNTSLHMKALAMKYLNDEQLADMALQKPRLNTLKQGSNNIQNTNMSFATMHYLQRYHLLPGGNSNPVQVETRREEYNRPGPAFNERLVMKPVERRELSPHRYLPLTGSSKISYPSKILDISTLKQQPKLL